MALVMTFIVSFLIFMFYIFYKKLPKTFFIIFTVLIFIVTCFYTLPLSEELGISIKEYLSSFGQKEIARQIRANETIVSLTIFSVPLLIIGFFWFLVGKVHNRSTTTGLIYAGIYVLLLGLCNFFVGILAAIIYFKNQFLVILKRLKKYIPD